MTRTLPMQFFSLPVGWLRFKWLDPQRFFLEHVLTECRPACPFRLSVTLSVSEFWKLGCKRGCCLAVRSSLKFAPTSPLVTASMQRSWLEGFPARPGSCATCIKYSTQLFCGQGMSSAGLQKGLADQRSKLVNQRFRVFDEMPFGPDTKLSPEEIMSRARFCHLCLGKPFSSRMCMLCYPKLFYFEWSPPWHLSIVLELFRDVVL